MTLPRNQEELEAWIRDHGEAGITKKIRSFEGKVSKSGQMFSQTDVEAESDEGLVSISLISSFACSFGHIIGSDGHELSGQCSVCGKFVCSAEGCARTCVEGHTICGRHSVNTKEGVYCTGHLAGLALRKTPGVVFRALKWMTESW